MVEATVEVTAAMTNPVLAMGAQALELPVEDGEAKAKLVDHILATVVVMCRLATTHNQAEPVPLQLPIRKEAVALDTVHMETSHMVELVEMVMIILHHMVDQHHTGVITTVEVEEDMEVIEATGV